MIESVLNDYKSLLISSINALRLEDVEALADLLLEVRKKRKTVYICGNGGSAANAMHIANDFIYGIYPGGESIKVEALSSNSAVMTCLGNDTGYENIYAHQLKVKSESGDVLIVLSGSGNSPNIIAAIEQAKISGVMSVAVVGFKGGKAKEKADLAIHFNVDDMQVSEDMQTILGHVLMKALYQKLSSKTHKCTAT